MADIQSIKLQKQILENKKKNIEKEIAKLEEIISTKESKIQKSNSF